MKLLFHAINSNLEIIIENGIAASIIVISTLIYIFLWFYFYRRGEINMSSVHRLNYPLAKTELVSKSMPFFIKLTNEKEASLNDGFEFELDAKEKCCVFAFWGAKCSSFNTEDAARVMVRRCKEFSVGESFEDVCLEFVKLERDCGKCVLKLHPELVLSDCNEFKAASNRVGFPCVVIIVFLPQGTAELKNEITNEGLRCRSNQTKNDANQNHTAATGDQMPSIASLMSIIHLPDANVKMEARILHQVMVVNNSVFNLQPLYDSAAPVEDQAKKDCSTTSNQHEESISQKLCIICYSNKPCLMLPCRHLVVCSNCLVKMDKPGVPRSCCVCQSIISSTAEFV